MYSTYHPYQSVWATTRHEGPIPDSGCTQLTLLLAERHRGGARGTSKAIWGRPGDGSVLRHMLRTDVKCCMGCLEIRVMGILFLCAGSHHYTTCLMERRQLQIYTAEYVGSSPSH